MEHNSGGLEVWKIIVLPKWMICRFHVNLPGCRHHTTTHAFFVQVRICGLFCQETWKKKPAGFRTSKQIGSGRTCTSGWLLIYFQQVGDSFQPRQMVAWFVIDHLISQISPPHFCLGMVDALPRTFWHSKNWEYLMVNRLGQLPHFTNLTYEPTFWRRPIAQSGAPSSTVAPQRILRRI